jgi:LmbE family N-acetylglucosaminyl deacetylase
MVWGTIVFLVCLLLVCLPVILNRLVNDRSVPTSDSLVEDESPRKILVLFPHPDDEVTIAGTLGKLKQCYPDLELVLVYLTKGEAGPTGGLVTREELGEARAEEVKQAARLLRADHLELLDLGDGQLKNRNIEEIKSVVRQMVAKYKPSTIVTFDSQIGLYGHADHMLTGLSALEVFEEDKLRPDFPVTRVYCTTLCKPMLRLAKRLSRTFRERYPKDPANGLPPATVAVKIASAAAVKGAVVRAHLTQWQVMRDVQPYYNKLPSWLYYRIFDREYLSLAARRWFIRGQWESESTEG